MHRDATSNSNGGESLGNIIVIGGGPAGSTAATLLAQHGCRVTLFERERFPRFHIGESLIPQTFFVLQRLGMIEKLRASHFTKKYSVQFITQHGKLSEPFTFGTINSTSLPKPGRSAAASSIR